MIIRNGDIISDNDVKITKFTHKTYDVYLKGFLFVSGKKLGEESVLYLVEKLFKNLEHEIFKEIYGQYFIYAIDHVTGTQHAFTDNGGLFRVYRFKDCIATSFLELIDFFREINLKDLNFQGIAEFFQLGFPHFQNTFINGVEVLDGNQFLKWEHGQLSEMSKELSGIDGPSSIEMESFFSDLVYALNEKKTSLDITGGFDSRLILSFFLKYRAPFELATSGAKNHIDVIIAKKIENKIGADHFQSIHSTDQISVQNIKEIYKLTDSQIDVIQYHSTNQSNNYRIGRNIEACLNGVGGGFYNDFWWLQDFPFYNRKKADLKKLFKYRIRAILFPFHIIGEKLIKPSKNLKKHMLSKFTSYTKETNTQTYDNISYNSHVKASASVYLTCANNYFMAYSPLLEPEMVKIGYGLKRRHRFFHLFHRKVITQNSPLLSKMRTAHGITASYSSLYIISDTFFYVFDIAKRVLKQILRKLVKKNYFDKKPIDNTIYDKWRINGFFKKQLNSLKEFHLLNPELDAKNVPNEMVGKILTLGMLIERLRKNN